MGTHYHLMLEVPEKALPVGMQSLNFRHAIDFNQRHGMRGHVQFARYGAVRINSDSHLLTAYKYVARNPVEAQLCGNCEDWPWSSYAAAIGLAEPNSFVDPMRVLASFDLVRGLLASATSRAFVKVVTGACDCHRCWERVLSWTLPRVPPRPDASPGEPPSS